MEIDINIEAHVRKTKVRYVNLFLSENVAYVNFEGDKRETVKVDLKEILSGYINEKSVLEDFFSKIISTAMNVDKTAIPESEIFKVEEKAK